jgi:hypothetical protein
MSKRVMSYVVVALVGMLFSAAFQPFASLSSYAQGGCQSFPQTGKQVCGRFLQYWQQNGGLAQQGLPLTGEFTEVSDLNGQSYTVQYFERAVFEKHPENAAPFDVLLSQLGTFQFKRKYPGGDPSGGAPPPAANTPVPPSSGDITISGSGSINTAPFTLPAGNFQVNWTAQNKYSSSTNLILDLNAVDGSFAPLLVNIITQSGESRSGTTNIYNIKAGQYYIGAIATETDWSVTFKKQ